MSNEELVKELKQIDKDFEKSRQVYQKALQKDNSIENLLEINKKINQMIDKSNGKTYDYATARKKRVKNGGNK